MTLVKYKLNTNLIHPNNRIDFNKVEGSQIGYNKTVKFENHLLAKDKSIKNQNKVEETYSFSSFERQLTANYESLSDDNEFSSQKTLTLEVIFNRILKTVAQ